MYLAATKPLPAAREFVMYPKILVPLYVRDSAAQGLQEAVALARQLKSPRRLLHMVDDYPMSAPRPADAGRPPWGSSKVAKPHLLESSVASVRAADGSADAQFRPVNLDPPSPRQAAADNCP